MLGSESINHGASAFAQSARAQAPRVPLQLQFGRGEPGSKETTATVAAAILRRRCKGREGCKQWRVDARIASAARLRGMKEATAVAVRLSGDALPVEGHRRGESTVALGCVRGWGRAGREGRPKKANEMSCVERGDNGDGCGCDGVSGVYRAASRQLPRLWNRLKKSAQEEKSVLSFPPATTPLESSQKVGKRRKECIELQAVETSLHCQSTHRMH